MSHLSWNGAGQSIPGVRSQGQVTWAFPTLPEIVVGEMGNSYVTKLISQ